MRVDGIGARNGHAAFGRKEYASAGTFDNNPFAEGTRDFMSRPLSMDRTIVSNPDKRLGRPLSLTAAQMRERPVLYR